MAKSVKDMVAAADEVVPKIDTAEAQRLVRDENALIVDVRDASEVAKTGKVAGAENIPRGLLEFKADPESPTHAAAMDPKRPVILYCAAGGRAALSGHTLSQMGYDRVFNMGGFKDAVDGGMDIEKP